MKKLILLFLAAAFLCLEGCADGDSVVYQLSADSSERADLSASVGDGSEESDTGSSAEELSERSDSITDQSAAVDSSSEVFAGSEYGTGPDTGLVYVYVCGAVNTPGVYILPKGSRVYEAIAEAGGLTPEADGRCLNQALSLEDGEQIIVYTREETQQYGLTGSAVSAAAGGTAASGETGTSPTDSGKINLNTAGKEELMTLPGIGEVKAESIIQYRTEHGNFSSIEDVQNIDGIKEKAFNKIKDYIEV